MVTTIQTTVDAYHQLDIDGLLPECLCLDEHTPMQNIGERYKYECFPYSPDFWTGLIEILPLGQKWSHREGGGVRISWPNLWSAGLGCGFAFANLLGMEYESKNALILRKKSILYSILHTQNTPIFCSNTPPKMGYLRCDSRGIHVTGTYPWSRNLRKIKFHLNGITNFLRGVAFLFHRIFHQSNRHLS
jgi:hypothetical protein